MFLFSQTGSCKLVTCSTALIPSIGILIFCINYCSIADEEKEAMRKQMREELLAQMEWNNQNMANMTSWDDQVR